MTDFRALCAELVDALENARRIIDGADGTLHINTAEFVLTRARALLDQPMAEGPTDEELVNFRNRATADCCTSRSNNGANLLSGDDLVACQAAGLRAVLAKWGRQ